MTAQVSDLDLYRCGGNGFAQQFGALLLGLDLENVEGITVKDVRIIDPTFSGIDIRSVGAGSGSSKAILTSTDLQNVTVTGAPSCGAVGKRMRGNVSLQNVCSCATPTSAPTECDFHNASSAAFQIETAAACSLQSCR
jgi:hypothetical protein